MDRRRFLQGAAFAGVSARFAEGRSRAGEGGESRRGAESVQAQIHEDEVMGFCKDILRIPSFTTEEVEVANFIKKFLEKEGFESRLQEVDPGRVQVIARLPGSGGGKSLMFDGHIDIDPLPSGLPHNPFEPFIEGDRIYGGGIGNMKGGVTAMAMAAVAAKRSGITLRGDVIVAGVVGELQGGVGTVRLLESGVRADMAIVPEPYGIDKIITKHTGVIEGAINVFGRHTHISRKKEGINAILKMTKVARALDRIQFRHEPDPELPGLPLINVGSIMGGRGQTPGPYPTEIRGPNNVPDFCSLFFDIRFPEGMTPDTIREDIAKTLDALVAEDAELKYEIELPMRPEWRCLREVMLPFTIPIDHPLVQTLKAKVTQIRGEEPLVGVSLPLSYAGNDTSHLYAAGIPCCLYGPQGEGYVWGSVEEVMTCTKVFGEMIAEVCA